MQSCSQDADGLYEAMEKAVARSEVHEVSLTLYLQIEWFYLWDCGLKYF